MSILHAITVIFAAALLAVAVAADAAPAQTPAPAAAQPSVLVFAYGPFAGRGVNGSQTIAEAIPADAFPGHHLRVRVLPVVWGQPEIALAEELAKGAPVLIVGLGEGHPGRVAVEQQAVNKAEHPDERGTAPPATLLAGGPEKRAARWAFAAAWFADSTVKVTASNDAGTYLCNNMLYAIAGSTVAKVGFIHLPPQGDTAADAYRAAYLPIVTELIRRNLAP